MQKLLLVLCAIAMTASLIAFGVLLLRPDVAERELRSAVVVLLKREMSDRFGGELTALGAAQALQRDLRDRVGAAEKLVADPLLDVLALALSDLCHYECGGPAELTSNLRTQLRGRIAKLESAIARIRAWAESRFTDFIRELVTELRVFTGTNFLLPLLAFLAAIRTPSNRNAQVFAALLLSSTLLASYCYLANQNWLMNLVFSDYVGWAYSAWVASLLAFLSDLVFLRGRVTNALTSAVGAMFAAVTS